MAGKSKYSAAERQAYATGRAYRLGRENRAIKFKEGSPRKASFRAGFQNAGKHLDKYDPIKKK